MHSTPYSFCTTPDEYLAKAATSTVFSILCVPGKLLLGYLTSLDFYIVGEGLVGSLGYFPPSISSLKEKITTLI